MDAPEQYATSYVDGVEQCWNKAMQNRVNGTNHSGNLVTCPEPECTQLRRSLSASALVSRT